MLFGKTKTELRVGIFVFIGIIILSFAILMIGKFRTWFSGYRIQVVFNFVNGVKVGAPVRFAGMDAGEVKRLQQEYLLDEKRTKITVVAWVKKEVRIPADSTVWVNTLGLLGEKYLEIMPGQDYLNCLKPEGLIKGVDPIAMHEVMCIAKKITENIDDAITRLKNQQGTAGKLLYGDEFYNELNQTAKNLEEFTSDIKRNPWKLLFKAKEVPPPKK